VASLTVAQHRMICKMKTAARTELIEGNRVAAVQKLRIMDMLRYRRLYPRKFREVWESSLQYRAYLLTLMMSKGAFSRWWIQVRAMYNSRDVCRVHMTQWELFPQFTDLQLW
jgi:hypothetical protein